MAIIEQSRGSILSSRIKQRVFGQTRIMWGLSDQSRKVATTLLQERKAILDFSVDPTMPSGLRSNIVRQGVSRLSFELGKVEGPEILTLQSAQSAVESLIRHVALRGLSPSEDIIHIDQSTFIPSTSDISVVPDSPHSPLESPYLKEENITLTTSPDTSAIVGSFNIKVDITSKITGFDPFLSPSQAEDTIDQGVAMGIIRNLKEESPLSLTSLRGGLSDIVMRDEASVSKFKALTERFINLNNGDLPLRAKARELKKEIDTQFPAVDRASQHWLMRLGLNLSDCSPTVFYLSFKALMTQAARLFIAGENISTALSTINRLAKRNMGYIVDFVAEEATSAAVARTNLARYLDAIDRLPKYGQEKMISIKLSGLVPEFNASEAHKELAIKALRELMVKSHRRDAMVVIDMEQFYRVGITLDILEEFTRRTNYYYLNNLGIVNQTYLKSSLEVTQRLKDFAKECFFNTAGRRKLFVRFVKGAYPEFDKEFVLESHEAANVRFIECLKVALQDSKIFRIAVASHNLRTITEAQDAAEEFDVDTKSLEFEMLLGMPARPILYSLADMGYKTRFYLPVGSFLESIGYFMRRMKENANSSSCQKLFREFQKGRISLEDYLERVFTPIPPPPIEEIPA